jgi:hypothetical protein
MFDVFIFIFPFCLYIHSQVLIVQDGPLASLFGVS